jgi:hypothetical protein
VWGQPALSLARIMACGRTGSIHVCRSSEVLIAGRELTATPTLRHRYLLWRFVVSGPERNAEGPKEPQSFDQLSSVVTQLEGGGCRSRRLSGVWRCHVWVASETRPFDAELDDE